MRWGFGPAAGGPRLAAATLACLYVEGLFGILQHGIFGPIGFAIRYCGPKSDSVAQVFRLNSILLKPVLVVWAIYSAILIYLVLRKKANVPRWTVLLCPGFTYWLESVIVHVPAPLGYPLVGGCTNVAGAVFFAVFAVSWKDEGIKGHAAQLHVSGKSNSEVG